MWGGTRIQHPVKELGSVLMTKIMKKWKKEDGKKEVSPSALEWRKGGHGRDKGVSVGKDFVTMRGKRLGLTATKEKGSKGRRGE